jgi:hypothetical protein
MSATFSTVLGPQSHQVSVEKVRALHSVHLTKFAKDGDPLKATRTEVHALLQLDCPFPGEECVTDEHRVRCDVERAMDPNHTSAHHWLQKNHGKALWAETDRLVAEAGVK